MYTGLPAQYEQYISVYTGLSAQYEQYINVYAGLPAQYQQYEEHNHNTDESSQHQADHQTWQTQQGIRLRMAYVGWGGGGGGGSVTGGFTLTSICVKATN